MARYFFDIDDGDQVTWDTDGVECSSREEIRRRATGVLPEVARDELPDGDFRQFWVKVRNEQGQYVFEASLVLRAGWID